MESFHFTRTCSFPSTRERESALRVYSCLYHFAPDSSLSWGKTSLEMKSFHSAHLVRPRTVSRRVFVRLSGHQVMRFVPRAPFLQLRMKICVLPSCRWVSNSNFGDVVISVFHFHGRFKPYNHVILDKFCSTLQLTSCRAALFSYRPLPKCRRNTRIGRLGNNRAYAFPSNENIWVIIFLNFRPDQDQFSLWMDTGIGKNFTWCNPTQISSNCIFSWKLW